MITTAQQDDIEDYAYVPEHIPRYVTAISQAEPFIFGDFLTYAKKDLLIFVGYPLKETFEENRMKSALDEAIERFKPETVSLTAPAIPSFLRDRLHAPPDYYYRVDLSSLSISQKLRNMLTRARGELSVEKSKTFDEEHTKMVKEFLKAHPVEEATRFLFQRIDRYLSSSTSAWIFDARNERNELVAFDVAELQPRSYSLYMFNFTSDALYVPGASDLLLSEVIEQAKAERKTFINLGLGINPGITFFKEKWGGAVFLPYTFCLFHPSTKESLETLLQKL
jgi:hypothetical protein